MRCITGRDTFSAAQHLTTILRQYTNLTQLGEPTAGKPNHYGAIKTLSLPNSGLPIQVSQVYHQDATPWEFNTTSRPHVHVSPTAEDCRENRDPMLDRVLTFDEIKATPARLTEEVAAAYRAGGIEGLKKKYFELRPEYLKAGVDLRDPLVDFFTPLYRINKSLDDQLAYGNFVVAEYPGEAFILYALGTQYAQIGQYDKAHEMLQRCLDAYPGNANARREMRVLDLAMSRR